MMTPDLLERGQDALKALSEEQLPAVVRWLELLSKHNGLNDVEPEELWLLATGALEKLNREIENAQPIDEWRRYLDEL